MHGTVVVGLLCVGLPLVSKVGTAGNLLVVTMTTCMAQWHGDTDLLSGELPLVKLGYIAVAMSLLCDWLS